MATEIPPIDQRDSVVDLLVAIGDAVFDLSKRAHGGDEDVMLWAALAAAKAGRRIRAGMTQLRILRLARAAAEARHDALGPRCGVGEIGPGEPDYHHGRFDACAHPDCALVRNTIAGQATE